MSEEPASSAKPQSSTRINGVAVVGSYENGDAETRYLAEAAGLLDFRLRGRFCALGADRGRFLHGQLTNDVNRLEVGQCGRSFLVTNKGKTLADVFVHALSEEILLDCEMGVGDVVLDRLNRFIVADDVEIVDVGPGFCPIRIDRP